MMKRFLQRAWAAGALLAAAGLLAGGCASRSAVAQTQEAMVAMPDLARQAVDIDMGLRMYVAKKGRAPASAAELEAFVGREGTGLEIAKGWVIAAGIADGVCRYRASFDNGTAQQKTDGSFAVAGLNYDSLVEANADMQKALNATPKKTGVQGEPGWLGAPTPTENQARGLGQ
jgi:hypothetical protein